MSEDAAYLLFTRPTGRAVIRDFFNAYGEVFALLTRPPETRDGSFGMRMAAMPQLVGAKYWDLHGQDPFHGRTRRLRLFPDGTLIFRAAIDESFLSWPHEGMYRLINPVVVADSVVSFCRLARRVSDLMSTVPSGFEFGIELRNAAESDPPLKMYPGRLRSATELPYLSSNLIRGVSEASPRRVITTTAAELVESTPNDDFAGADRVAFSVVRDFYDIFGFGENDIPYVDRTDGAPRIAIKAFD